MAFRYRILLFHENQVWVNSVIKLLDVPIFHLIVTDSNKVMQEHLDAENIDIIIASINAKHFSIVYDGNDSLSFKQIELWKSIEEQKRHYQIILLCSRRDLETASELVHDGKIADYLIVSPFLDRNRLIISIMKTLEATLLREIVMKNAIQTEKLPKHLLESIETLQMLRSASEFLSDFPHQVVEDDTMTLASQENDSTPGERLSTTDNNESTSPSEISMSTDHFFPNQKHSGNHSTEADNAPLKAKFKPLEYTLDESNIVVPSVDHTIQTAWVQKPEKNTEKVPLNGHKKPSQKAPVNTWTRITKSDYDVLLIDANPTNINKIKMVLAQEDYSVLDVHTAHDALAVLNKEIFTLLILNFELPDQSGLYFLRRLRSKGPQSNIPAIMLADQAKEEFVIKSINVGADYFIASSFKPDQLLKYVNNLIR